MDNVLLQIQKDGINAKEFRIVLNNYNKAKNEAAHVNNNQSKITRTIEKRKNINKPYKWEDSLHTSNEGQICREYFEEMYINGSWRVAVQIMTPKNDEKPDMYEICSTVQEIQKK